MYYYEMLFTLLIIAVIAIMVVKIVKMSLKHAENMKRIEHGYPTLDGSKPLVEERELNENRYLQ